MAATALNKLASSITGYQPQSEEIVSAIELARLKITLIPRDKEWTNSHRPPYPLAPTNRGLICAFL